MSLAITFSNIARFTGREASLLFLISVLTFSFKSGFLILMIAFSTSSAVLNSTFLIEATAINQSPIFRSFQSSFFSILSTVSSAIT
nr:MAG TPA: hypothetical protein [Caudoviricetes sp.]